LKPSDEENLRNSRNSIGIRRSREKRIRRKHMILNGMNRSLDKLVKKKKFIVRKMDKSRDKIKEISRRNNPNDSKSSSFFIVEYAKDKRKKSASKTGQSGQKLQNMDFYERQPTFQDVSCDCYSPPPNINNSSLYFSGSKSVKRQTMATKTTFSKIMRRSREKIKSNKTSKDTILSVYDSKK
jgi:hypothetical protein